MTPVARVARYVRDNPKGYVKQACQDLCMSPREVLKALRALGFQTKRKDHK